MTPALGVLRARAVHQLIAAHGQTDTNRAERFRSLRDIVSTAGRDLGRLRDKAIALAVGCADYLLAFAIIPKRLSSRADS